MKRIARLLATTRVWTDSEGKRHKLRAEVGAIFAAPSGRQSIKLDLVPVAKEWDGWLAVAPVDDGGTPIKESP